MKIEFLYSDECPHADEALKRLEETVAPLSPKIEILKLQVNDLVHAKKVGFWGSPSVHIDGVDLEGKDERPPSLSCRLYGVLGAPPKWLIEAAVLRAQKPKGFLFLCVANSARSQIAEGVARKLAPEGIRVQSAGSHPTSVRPEAQEVLVELGIDTSSHFSKNVDDIDPATVDTVITLCAEEECPVFLGKASRIHWGLPDPAAVQDTDEEVQLNAFRRTRDELAKRLEVVFNR